MVNEPVPISLSEFFFLPPSNKVVLGMYHLKKALKHFGG